MTWRCYRLAYRLETPLRVGRRESGNLQSTRPYVPGRVLWAALTARLTRNQGMGRTETEYRSVGSILLENLRFGYLWPSLDGESPCYPWEDPEDFDYHFLSSYVSTALDYGKQGALDGSLHEAEFLMPRTRQGLPVYLVGWLWAREEAAHNGWQQALSQVTLGGERRYGWGRVKLVSPWQPVQNPPISDPDDFTWDGKIPAHARPNTPDELGWQGEVEPLVGWEAHGSRKTLTAQVLAAYAPGAQAPQGKRLRIRADNAIWEALD